MSNLTLIIRSIKRRAPLDNDTLVAVTHPDKNICFGKDMHGIILQFDSKVEIC